MITFIKIAITISFIYAVVALIGNFIAKYRKLNFEIPFKNSLFKWIAIAFAVLQIADYANDNCIYYVDGQEVAVKIGLNGLQDKPIHSGLHFKWGWERIRTLDKTVWVYTFAQKGNDGQRHDADAIWASTKDVIKVGMDVSAAWCINSEKAPEIYSLVSSINDDGGANKDSTVFRGKYKWIEENIIRPLVVSNITNVVALYSPMEVISTKRQNIQKEVYKRVSEDLKKYNLKLMSVDFRQVYYNKDYEKSVVAIQTAAKEVERLKEITKQKDEQLVQAGIDKNIKIKDAEGDAESMRVRGEAISANPKVVTLEFFKTWDGKYPTTLIMNGKPESLILNMDK